MHVGRWDGLRQPLGRLGQFGLDVVDGGLEPGDIGVATLHAGPLALLDQLTQLQLEADGVVG